MLTANDARAMTIAARERIKNEHVAKIVESFKQNESRIKESAQSGFICCRLAYPLPVNCVIDRDEQKQHIYNYYVSLGYGVLFHSTAYTVYWVDTPLTQNP